MKDNGRNNIYLLLCFILAGVLIVMSGCHTDSSGRHEVDSTIVKAILDMQMRGTLLRNSSNFEEAMALHDSCIVLAQQIADTTQLILALNNQGTNYRRLGDMDEASNYHSEALGLCEKCSDKTSFEARKNRLISLNGLGNTYMTINDYEAAEAVFREALAGEEYLGSATGQAINLANIGSIKESLGFPDSARIYYNRSMEKNREANNIVGISLCYSFLGNLAQKSGDYESAMKNFHEAYAIGLTTNDTWHWLTPCISLIENFLHTNRPDSASRYIGIGLAAAVKIHSNEHLAKLYELRSRLEDLIGEESLALRDLQLSNIYNDSVRNENTRNSVQNNRVAYESNRRVTEVRQAEENARSSRLIRNLIIIILGILLITALVLLSMYGRMLRARKKSAAERDIFYRNITHQLRTPMTVVLGMIDQLKGHIPASDKEGRANLDAAQRQGRNLLELMKSLIVAAKENRLESVDISDTTQIKTSDSGDDTTANSANRGTIQKSILVAEDNEDVALLMCSVLRHEGYAVTHALDGREALDLLNEEVPDLLITDIAMPRMDGLELMRSVRSDETMNHLPIIVVSARVENHERLEGITAGAEVYIGKPFVVDELLMVVRKTLEQRELLRNKYKDDQTKDISAEPMSKDEQDFLNQLNALIDENMRFGEVNSTFLAEKFSMSMSTLNRRLRNLTDMSPTLYIRSRKMNKAKALLVETDKPINEIEWMCGFNTAGHFSRIFRSEFGITPLEYRRQMRGK